MIDPTPSKLYTHQDTQASPQPGNFISGSQSFFRDRASRFVELRLSSLFISLFIYQLQTSYKKKERPT